MSLTGWAVSQPDRGLILRGRPPSQLVLAVRVALRRLGRGGAVDQAVARGGADIIECIEACLACAQACTECARACATRAGLVDPEVEVRPVRGQVDDLLAEIRERAERNERVLVTTLTKRMAEDLTDYFQGVGVRVRYLHSDIGALERVEILRDLRLGEFDVLVGINLLREGLDLPEVSLVAILDADKEGFLRSETSLIQTIGRAARNVSGQVHMYADKITPSMEMAIGETNRRRAIQVAYNTERGIDPQPLRKKIADITEMLAREDETTQELLKTWADVGQKGRAGGVKAGKSPTPALSRIHQEAPDTAGIPSSDLAELIQELTDQMKTAAAELHFEVAARLRDEISDLKRELRQMMEATK